MREWYSVFESKSGRLLLKMTFVLSLVSACSVTKVATKKWVQVETKHFRVMSSLAPQKTHDLTVELELFRAMLKKYVHPGAGPSEAVTKVFVFDSSSSFKHFCPAKNAAGYFRRGWKGDYMLLDGNAFNMDAKQILFHEYVHAFLRHTRAKYPLWYEEGLAEFFSTARLDKGMFIVGHPPLRFGLRTLKNLSRGSNPRNVRHLTPRNTGEEKDLWYTHAWAVVDYLFLGYLAGSPDRRQELAKFMQAVNRGEPEEKAFRSAFGLTRKEIDQELFVYLRKGQLPLIKIKATSLDTPKVPSASRVDFATKACKLGWLSWEVDRLDDAKVLFEGALAKSPDAECAKSGISAVKEKQK